MRTKPKKKPQKRLQLFGHWEDVRVQGTCRTYRFYAYHPLDRILAIGIFMGIYVVLYILCFCHDGPGRLAVLLWRRWVVYVPTDMGLFFRPFLILMIFLGLFCIPIHVEEHRRQQRILRGELVSRQGVLCEIGRRRISKTSHYEYRFLLRVQGPGGKVLHEVYEMPEEIFEEIDMEHTGRACHVELALLPPKDPDKKNYLGYIPPTYVNKLHMRVEHIFWLEALPVRCETIDRFLFDREQSNHASPKPAEKRGQPKGKK